jgi:hypothetical protein
LACSGNPVEGTRLAVNTAGMAASIECLFGFVIPQPVKASRPTVGTDWIHEIKHDGSQ